MLSATHIISTVKYTSHISLLCSPATCKSIFYLCISTHILTFWHKIKSRQSRPPTRRIHALFVSQCVFTCTHYSPFWDNYSPRFKPKQMNQTYLISRTLWICTRHYPQTFGTEYISPKSSRPPPPTTARIRWHFASAIKSVYLLSTNLSVDFFKKSPRNTSNQLQINPIQLNQHFTVRLFL